MAWLVSAGGYHVIDVLRANRPGLTRRYTLDDPGALSAFESTESGLTLAALQRCLEQLTPEQRRSVLLAYSHGLSHDDIAAQVASPLGTVKSWVRRGMQSLRRCMQS
jgi:RNA polymerase sigma-70 factor (ECF subfamily)